MVTASPAAQRETPLVRIDTDLAVIGGGLAGTCCAITAARSGLRVVLVQDRPVLGGNSSSEVRLWTLGATSHLGNNNRWAREGGVIDELLVENMARNPEGNTLMWDALLLDKATSEPRLTLLLNTAVHDLTKNGADRIESVTAFCSQNSTRYEIHAPYFCDASGDGIVGFMAGAAFRMGAEAREEFGEKFAPDASYGELLGHSIYFYSKDVGRPVRFVPPGFALTDITQIPRWREFTPKDFGCRLWWIEYGGRLDTIHETERIKWELWKIVYGVWNHIKNSGQFPEAETLTLEWVGTIPGKRESRRFEGDYILRQQDVIEQSEFDDVVSFGGWSIDLHPADGVYSPRKGCDQWHSRGVYQIPFRCMYSRNIDNLFLAGRLISVTHVAFGSSRVMATGAHGGQAVALAAKQCIEEKVLPRALLETARMRKLQTALMRTGQYLPRRRRVDAEDLAQSAKITSSSELRLAGFRGDGSRTVLKHAWAQMIPLQVGRVPRFTLTVDVSEPTTLTAELRTSDHSENHTPDQSLATRNIELKSGANQLVHLDFEVTMDAERYGFVTLAKNEAISVATTSDRLTGVLSVAKAENPEVSNYGEQIPPTDRDIGVERFEFWCPQRRPGGKNFAINIEPPIASFRVANVINGVARPTLGSNAWVADYGDPSPAVTLTWQKSQTIRRVLITFDCDYDHPAESSLWGHLERLMPFCPKSWKLRDAAGREVAKSDDQHLTRAEVIFPAPISTQKLTLELGPTHGGGPPSVFEISCFS
ncbi:MAG: FAD-dependent oxidoreductase [Opitutus sp.]